MGGGHGGAARALCFAARVATTGCSLVASSKLSARHASPVTPNPSCIRGWSTGPSHHIALATRSRGVSGGVGGSVVEVLTGVVSPFSPSVLPSVDRIRAQPTPESDVYRESRCQSQNAPRLRRCTRTHHSQACTVLTQTHTRPLIAIFPAAA